MSLEELPFEVLFTILLMLPVDSIFRAMWVSKKWRSLISSAEFLHKHFQNSVLAGNQYVLCVPEPIENPPNDHFHILSYANPCVTIRENILCPSIDGDLLYYDIVGFSGGLVCLKHPLDSTFYLWNPFIRKSKKLVNPSDLYEGIAFLRTLAPIGFGHLCGMDVHDHKIVRITHKDYEYDSEEEVYHDETPENIEEIARENPNYTAQVEVYSLSSDSWKTFNVTKFSWYIDGRNSSVQLNNRIHWIARTYPRRVQIVVSFDLVDEVFNQITLPPFRNDFLEDPGLELTVYKDNLSLLVLNQIDELTQRFCLWMKNDSWSRMYNVVLRGVVQEPPMISANDEIVLALDFDDDGEYDESMGFRLYNMRSQETRTLVQSGNVVFLPMISSLSLQNHQQVPNPTRCNDSSRGFIFKKVEESAFCIDSYQNRTFDSLSFVVMKGMEGEREKVGAILMQKYEVGRLLGQGTFAKVYHARNINTGVNVAIKIINKEKVVKVGLIDQIKREISVMRLVKHPNVVRLYEVMASKTRIYFAMEFVKGGELFNKVARGRLKEDAARKYFQQLMAAVDFCHSRGVYHRDLKPENLLLDEFGNLKVSDFGLSALHDSRGQDGLLHTTCGTPAYVAPEVIHKKGYDGEKADIWSCGVILFVLLAGYLPFHDTNLMEMYKKISKAEFRCPHWFPPEVKKLLSRILDPNPNARMTLVKIMENSWFRKGFKEIQLPNEDGDDDNDDEEFKESSSTCILEIDHDMIDHHSDHEITTPRGNHKMRPTCLNAFDIISLSQGFNLSGLFEDAENCKPESRFTTTMPPSMIVERLEEVAAIDSFKFKMKDGMVKMQGNKGGRKGLLAIDAQIFEVTPSLHVVEVKKRFGDTLEYKNFCDHELRPSLKDTASNWRQGCTSKEQSH